MKIMALGGAGAMGRKALEVLAGELRVEEVIVADLQLAQAQQVAQHLRALGQPASAAAIDVTDGKALRALLAQGDLVMNSVGPYFRFGVPILQAAIEAGVDYIDICDDAQPTVQMLALHQQAQQAGITAIIGAGASPGFMNILAREAAIGLDQVHDILVGWTLNSAAHNWDMMREPDSGSSAAAVHLLEEFTGEVTITRKATLTTRRARETIKIDVPGLGCGHGYVVGHPEPVTLPATLNAQGESVSICLLSSDRAAALHNAAERTEKGEFRVDDVMEVLREAIQKPVESISDPDFPNGGDLPIYFVAVTGVQSGKPFTRFAGCLSKPQLMAEGTGNPYGIATAYAASHDLPAGVYPLDALLDDPKHYLQRVAARWGIAPEQLFFTGNAPGKLLNITPASATHSDNLS